MERKYLKEILIDSLDGDWGKSEPTAGHLRYHVIRGTDFKAVSEGGETAVPVRYLPERTVVRRTLEENDILIETAGGSRDRPTGRTLLVTRAVLERFDGPVTCASFARFLRVDRAIADPRYIYWFLQYLYNQGLIEQYQVQHTGVARFQYTQFAASQVIPLPSMGTQVGIAEVLGALDDKIAANRRLAQTTDELAVLIVRAAQADDTEVELCDVASVTMGSSPPGDSYNEDGMGMVFYQGNRDFGFRSPNNRVWTVDPKRVAQADDTLLIVRAPVGELNIASEETCIGRGLAALKSREGTPAVLYYRMKAAPRLWESYESGGTVFGSINGKELNSLKIPALIDAHALEPLVYKLDRIVASAQAESVQLATIRDALLPRLISGELRVRDAEEVVSNAVRSAQEV